MSLTPAKKNTELNRPDRNWRVSGGPRAFTAASRFAGTRPTFRIFVAIFLLAGNLLRAAEDVAVHHTPLQPRSGEVVHIKAALARATSATLQYQVVEPGGYIAL